LPPDLGASAPLKDLLITFAIMAEKVEAAARAQVTGDIHSAKRTERRWRRSNATEGMRP